jgi:hypothetical protein
MKRASGFSVVIICLGLALPLNAASLEKARTLRSNGLLEDAKKELVDFEFSAGASAADKAEALLLLGDIGVDERKYDVAREDWSKVISLYPGVPAGSSARDKLKLLDQLAPVTSLGPAVPSAKAYFPGTMLIVGPDKFPWAVVQVSGALGVGAVPLKGTLNEAMQAASAQPSIVGLVEVVLDVDVVYESGRVICYRPNGEKIWEEKTMFNLGGGEERIARRFIDKLSARVKNRKCP